MANDINKYKHHLLIVAALMIANYLIMPLSEWQSELKQNLTLLEKQAGKVSNLIDDKAKFEEELVTSNKTVARINTSLFVSPSEGEFKLAVQASIEKVMKEAGCTIERIGFKGSNEVTKNVERWTLDVRYQGDIGCMTMATRKLESFSPLIEITSYNMNHSGLTDELTGILSGRMDIGVWHKVTDK